MYIIKHRVQSGQIPQGGVDHRVESTHTSAVNLQLSAVNEQVNTNKQILFLVNTITNRSFRVLPLGAKTTMRQFTMQEIETALTNLKNDPWHSKKIKDLSAAYLLRNTTIDKFLQAEPSSKFAPRGYA